MEIRYTVHPEDLKNYNSCNLRDKFLIENLFIPGQIKMVYCEADRMIVGGVQPQSEPISLIAAKEIAADYFLERREMGVINLGGEGYIRTDGKEFLLKKEEGLYIGKGTKKVEFANSGNDNTKFYFLSVPAHKKYPTKKISLEDITAVSLGDKKKSNIRKIYKYIHPERVKSCQLVMGITKLEENNNWNTMPCHTHDRRMEVYFYYDFSDEDLVFHLMGKPEETRHIVVRNEQVVISPSWSIHSGVGTTNYKFIWAMAGENQDFNDMDHVPMSKIK